MERIIIYWKQKSQERRSWCIKINVYDKKTELRDGVVKTIESKGKLAYIAFEYEETIETEKNKVDSDLEHLILINSIWKEKKIGNLERKFADNENEIHTRTRQIEQT